MTLRRLRLLLTILGLCVCLAPLGAHAATSPQTTNSTKPNIVFILVDNVGWGSFGVYGGPVATPRIDELANSGIRFNNYNVEVQCTPTRSAIHTARYSVRSGTYTVPLPGGGPAGLSPWEYTIAKLLSDAGYTTALYGKWHLGDIQGRMPNDMGYDEWWGNPVTWDVAGYTAYPRFKESGEPVPMLWAGKKGQPSRPVMPINLSNRGLMDGQYIIPKTIDFIKRNAAAKKPFFVYIGYSEVHQPVIANPNFAHNAAPGGVMADIFAEMDYRVGQIMDAIKEAGIDDNTIVVFSSDNGSDGIIPQFGGSENGPWRGNFFDTPFEGSYRVPAMIRWPGHVPAGVVTQEMLADVDWMPTLAGMVGASNLMPKDRPIDGIDASAFMLGKSASTGRDSYMFFGSDGQLMSVKWKNYKTIFRYAPDEQIRPAIEQPYVTPNFPMMYDLNSDPHEDNNLTFTDFTNGWILGPDFKIIGAYERSVKQFPNIKPGENFKGYK